MRASGAHISVKLLRGKEGINNLTFLEKLGVELVIIPHDSRIDQADDIDELISELAELSKVAISMGLKLGYHSHSKEFAPFKDATFWDYLAQNTPDSFVLQLDVGWVNYAGHDAIAYIKRYPGRTLTTHYKIRTLQGQEGTPVIIGQDKYDWLKLYSTNIEFGRTQWIVIEQEEYPASYTPLEAVNASAQNLQKIITEYTFK